VICENNYVKQLGAANQNILIIGLVFGMNVLALYKYKYLEM